MSLYGTRASSQPAGPKSVWPYYFLSVFSVLLAISACIVFWPKDIPAPEDLVLTGGKMRTFVIRDDFSNSTVGAMLPIFTSAYMRFKDVEGEFRYPWTFPKYNKVRNETAVFVDIWVSKHELGGDGAPLIWGLVEKNHFKEADRQTIVLYEDLVEGQKRNGEILVKLTISLIAAAAVFWFLGVALGRRNRKKYPEYYS